MANNPASNKVQLITMPGNTDKDNLACQLGFATTKNSSVAKQIISPPIINPIGMTK